MKKILCTTDFSRPASKVCRYAAQLAKQTHAELYLLHASHPIFSYTPDMQVVATDTDLMQAVYEGRLKRLAKRLQAFAGGGLTIETINRDGFAVDVITETAKQLKPDLLVMSTVGQLPRSSELFGNVASSMISKAPVPVMFMPPKAKFRPFENVYMGVDVAQEIDAVALQQMIDSLKAFKAVINICSVVNDPEAAEVKEIIIKLREMLREHPHVIDITKGENFAEAFLDKVKTYKADLIVVFPKQHNWFERLVKLSNTEELVFRTDLPMIAIA